MPAVFAYSFPFFFSSSGIDPPKRALSIFRASGIRVIQQGLEMGNQVIVTRDGRRNDLRDHWRSPRTRHAPAQARRAHDEDGSTHRAESPDQSLP